MYGSIVRQSLLFFALSVYGVTADWCTFTPYTWKNANCKEKHFYVSDIVGLTSTLCLRATLQQCITSPFITLLTRSVLECKYAKNFGRISLVLS